ncbi:MAG: hypothetical protein QJR07_10945 [Acetobacteraceae bacterium]|nr:hypothetical protein [Acetobacteraceae bacterium]MDI3307607.1 hypothetical protein [Acetobacteraceae bacterium]
MGAILAGILVAVAIAVGAGFAMHSDNPLSWETYKTGNVRVGDPGTNLVGPGWTGENKPGATTGQAPPGAAPASPSA